MNVYKATTSSRSKSLFVLLNFIACFVGAQDYQVYVPELPVTTSAETRKLISQQLKNRVWKYSFNRQEEVILIDDLSALYELKGEGYTSSLYQSIFSQRQFDGKELVDWIFKKFQYIGPSKGETCGQSKEDSYLACYNLSDKEIRITPLFFKQSRVSRLSVLIHEARHAQGYHHSLTGSSKDDTIDAARGAQLSFFKAIILNCTNCLLMDKVSAFNNLKETAKEIENLNSHDQAVYNSEFSSLKHPYDLKYNSLVEQIKNERKIVSAAPYVCLNKIPFNEFRGQPVQALAEDCILLYYYVPSKEASVDPQLLKRRYQKRDGFLLIFNPVEKK